MTARPMISAKILVLSGALVLGAAAALVAGSALSTAPSTAAEPVETAIDFPVNESGDTYGSAAVVDDADDEPDLISVLATNGEEGYVYKDEFDEVSGANVANPDEAQKYMAEWEKHPDGIAIPVYEADGKTVIGEFVIQAPASTGEE